MSPLSERKQVYLEAAAQIEGERLGRAERLNGRIAMLGIVIGMLTEALTGHGIVHQVGFGIFGIS